MASGIVPVNKIQCEYRTLDELVEVLNRTLYRQQVVLGVHEVNGHGPDRMKSGIGTIQEVTLKSLPYSKGDLRVTIHVRRYGHISIRNEPVVFGGVEYPSEIYIEGNHVSLRQAHVVDSRRMITMYYTITALASLDD